MRTEPDQHDTDGGFQRARDVFGNGMTEQDRGACEDEKGQGVAQTPGQPVPDDVADIGTARGDAGDRCDMIGLERVLHSEQEAKTQNSKHPRYILI